MPRNIAKASKRSLRVVALATTTKFASARARSNAMHIIVSRVMGSRQEPNNETTPHSRAPHKPITPFTDIYIQTQDEHAYRTNESNWYVRAVRSLSSGRRSRSRCQSPCPVAAMMCSTITAVVAGRNRSHHRNHHTKNDNADEKSSPQRTPALCGYIVC